MGDYKEGTARLRGHPSRLKRKEGKKAANITHVARLNGQRCTITAVIRSVVEHGAWSMAWHLTVSHHGNGLNFVLS
jgi:hypothetical protein